MPRNLKTIADFAEQSAFSEGQIRWFIFHRAANGLDEHGGIVKLGRRVYVDEDAFFRWVDSQQDPRAA